MSGGDGTFRSKRLDDLEARVSSLETGQATLTERVTVLEARVDGLADVVREAIRDEFQKYLGTARKVITWLLPFLSFISIVIGLVS